MLKRIGLAIVILFIVVIMATFTANNTSIPACVHKDGSARVQTVNGQQNEKLHILLEHFYQVSGVPVLINTSFNIRGEPIVCAPNDAFRCLQATDMDVLVIENFILRKAVVG